MAKSDYLPKKDTEFLKFLKHLKDTLPGQKVALNVSDEDIATVTADTTLFESKLTAFTNADAIYSQTSTDKTAIRSAIETRLRSIVRRLKSATGYTDAFGQLLKIIGAEDSTDLTTAKPDLTVTAQGHGVELSFTKGKSDGVAIYSRRDNDGEFAFLARDTVAPYVDNRPLLVVAKPEVRRYKAVYVSGDEEIGNFSDEVVVTVYP
jgi:hypothetical protein